MAIPGGKAALRLVVYKFELSTIKNQIAKEEMALFSVNVPFEARFRNPIDGPAAVVSKDDHRRSAYHRYLTALGDAGDFDFDLLQIAGGSYLKSLDELHDDRGARLAADLGLWRSAYSSSRAA